MPIGSAFSGLTLLSSAKAAKQLTPLHLHTDLLAVLYRYRIMPVCCLVCLAEWQDKIVPNTVSCTILFLEDKLETLWMTGKVLISSIVARWKVLEDSSLHPLLLLPGLSPRDYLSFSLSSERAYIDSVKLLGLKPRLYILLTQLDSRAILSRKALPMRNLCSRECTELPAMCNLVGASNSDIWISSSCAQVQSALQHCRLQCCTAAADTSREEANACWRGGQGTPHGSTPWPP